MQQQVVWEGDTVFGHYQIVDGLYDGRPSRVLYSGEQRAAQSGLATDGGTNLLFDYNQRFLELAEGLQPKTVLVIGGGTSTLPKALLEHLPGVRVDVVEPDEGLTKLAYDFFEVPVDEHLRIFATDGRTSLREHAGRYDLLVVDAFHHTSIPAELKTVEAFQAYTKHLRPGGVLLVNVISCYYGSSAHPLERMYAGALASFGSVDLFLATRGYSLWLPQNFILAAQDGEVRLGGYTRGEPIKPPEVNPANVLHD